VHPFVGRVPVLRETSLVDTRVGLMRDLEVNLFLNSLSDSHADPLWPAKSTCRLAWIGCSLSRTLTGASVMHGCGLWAAAPLHPQDPVS